jgi:hypothetical protein
VAVTITIVAPPDLTPPANASITDQQPYPALVTIVVDQPQALALVTYHVDASASQPMTFQPTGGPAGSWSATCSLTTALCPDVNQQYLLSVDAWDTANNHNFLAWAFTRTGS